MKKLVILVLLVPMVALTMISCDADMRSNLAGFMGGFNSNVYADAGLIVANTAQAEAAAAAVATIGTGAGAPDVIGGTNNDSLGLDLTVPTGAEKMLAPQPKDKQDKLKDNLADAFNSKTQKDKLLDDLKTPVTDNDQKKAAKGTVLVVNQALEDLKTKLTGNPELGAALEKLKLPEIDTDDDLTQGDMLSLQLMTDLIANTVKTLKEIGDTGSGTKGLEGVTGDKLEANKTKVLSIIDDALFAAEVAEQISGSGSIDFTGQINLGDLMDGLGDKGTRSRGESVELTEAGDFIGIINDLAPEIVSLMGITYNKGTSEFKYSESTYKSFLLNQQVYRSSIEQVLKMKKLGKLEKSEITKLDFDLSTLIKYSLAVVLTEHHDFWVDEADEDKSPHTRTKASAIILNYLNTNQKLGLGTLETTDTLDQPDAIDNFDYARWPAFLESKGKDYYKAILENIIEINRLGGIAQLTEQLEDFRDNTTDGFDSWFDGLKD